MLQNALLRNFSNHNNVVSFYFSGRYLVVGYGLLSAIFFLTCEEVYKKTENFLDIIVYDKPATPVEHSEVRMHFFNSWNDFQVCGCQFRCSATSGDGLILQQATRNRSYYSGTPALISIVRLNFKPDISHRSLQSCEQAQRCSSPYDD